MNVATTNSCSHYSLTNNNVYTRKMTKNKKRYIFVFWEMLQAELEWVKVRHVYLQWSSISKRSQGDEGQRGQQPQQSFPHPPTWSWSAVSEVSLCSTLLLSSHCPTTTSPHVVFLYICTNTTTYTPFPSSSWVNDKHEVHFDSRNSRKSIRG